MYAPEASAAIVVRSKFRESPWWVMRKPPLSMTIAVVASVCFSNSRNVSSSCWMSSSMSCGSVAMSCVLRRSLSNELIEQHPRDHVECFEYAFAFVRHRSEGRDLNLAVVQDEFHVLHRSHVLQIPLVVLQHVGN